MIKKITLILACIFGLTLSPLLAFADGFHKDVVVDKEGKFVRNTFGNCVRSQWDIGRDKCKDVLMMMNESIIYFDFDKYNLKTSEITKLDKVIDVLKTHKIQHIKIIGYTDWIGTTDYNSKLSMQRAKAVKDYIDSHVTLKSSKTTVRGYGENNIVKQCTGYKGQELKDCLYPNRRVEIETDYLAMKY